MKKGSSGSKGASKYTSKQRREKEELPGYEDGIDSDDEEVAMNGRGRSGRDSDDDNDDQPIAVHSLEGVDTDSESDNDISRNKDDPSRWDRARDRELARLERQAKSWGKSRNVYYNSDTVDFESTKDMDVALEEESEARKLQRQQAAELAAEDLGLDEVLSLAKRSSASATSTSSSLSTSTLLGSMLNDVGVSDKTAEERIMQVIADSPELLSLLDEFTAKMKELKQEITPLLERTKAFLETRKNTSTNVAGSIAMEEGISFLQLKHQLLLSYCIHVTFYLLLKTEGKSVSNHPVIKR